MSESTEDTALNLALAEAWAKIGLDTQSVSVPIQVPYHGAEAVQTAVRAVIAATPTGANRPMSANIMIRLLVDHGMPEAMAVKLPSQIRKGATMHDEWKNAFSTGRFIQKLGRSMSAAAADANLKKARTSAHERSSLSLPTKVSASMPHHKPTSYTGPGDANIQSSDWALHAPPYPHHGYSPQYSSSHEQLPQPPAPKPHPPGFVSQGGPQEPFHPYGYSPHHDVPLLPYPSYRYPQPGGYPHPHHPAAGYDYYPGYPVEQSRGWAPHGPGFDSHYDEYYQPQHYQQPPHPPPVPAHSAHQYSETWSTSMLVEHQDQPPPPDFPPTYYLSPQAPSTTEGIAGPWWSSCPPDTGLSQRVNMDAAPAAGGASSATATPTASQTGEQPQDEKPVGRDANELAEPRSSSSSSSSSDACAPSSGTEQRPATRTDLIADTNASTTTPPLPEPVRKCSSGTGPEGAESSHHDAAPTLASVSAATADRSAQEAGDESPQAKNFPAAARALSPERAPAAPSRSDSTGSLGVGADDDFSGSETSSSSERRTNALLNLLVTAAESDTTGSERTTANNSLEEHGQNSADGGACGHDDEGTSATGRWTEKTEPFVTATAVVEKDSAAGTASGTAPRVAQVATNTEAPCSAAGDPGTLQKHERQHHLQRQQQQDEQLAQVTAKLCGDTGVESAAAPFRNAVSESSPVEVVAGPGGVEGEQETLDGHSSSPSVPPAVVPPARQDTGPAPETVGRGGEEVEGEHTSTCGGESDVKTKSVDPTSWALRDPILPLTQSRSFTATNPLATPMTPSSLFVPQIPSAPPREETLHHHLATMDYYPPPPIHQLAPEEVKEGQANGALSAKPSRDYKQQQQPAMYIDGNGFRRMFG